jgi:hypothetical protein
MNIQEDSTDIVKEIRLKLAVILKEADEFVELVDRRVKARENELNEQMKKYEVLKDKEKKLEDYRLGLDQREKELEVQKKANRDKQIALEKSEQEIQDKLKRVQSILN